GKYSPPHGNGRKTAGCSAQRLGSNRFYHSVHDPLLGRGVYSNSLHGRNHGAPLSRILRDDRVGHFAFGNGFADADTDVVQPLSSADRFRKAWPLLPPFGAGFSMAVPPLSHEPALGAETSPGHTGAQWPNPLSHSLAAHDRSQRFHS